MVDSDDFFVDVDYVSPLGGVPASPNREDLAAVWAECVSAAVMHLSSKVIAEDGPLDGYIDQYSAILGVAGMRNPYLS